MERLMMGAAPGALVADRPNVISNELPNLRFELGSDVHVWIRWWCAA